MGLVGVALLLLGLMVGWVVGLEDPVGIHLQITADPRFSARVMWSLPQTALRAVPPTSCIYGTDPSALDANVSALTSTYTAGGFKGALQQCELVNLQPATRYYYAIVANNVQFRTLHFTTAPELSAPIRAINWADMGIQNPTATSLHTQLAAANDVQNGSYTLIINAGDTSCALSPGTEARVFQFRLNAPHSPGVFGLLPHSCVVPRTDADDYNLEVLDIPNSWVLDRFCFYYSFDYGCVHFVSFSTEHDVSRGSEQWEFVVADLKRAQANRDKVPWIVAFTHHPFYCSSSTEPGRCGPEMDNFLEAFEDVFHQYGVDLFTSGHNHCYERSWPVYQKQPIKTLHRPNATVYVVNGAAGDIEGTQGGWTDNVDWRKDARTIRQAVSIRAAHINANQRSTRTYNLSFLSAPPLATKVLYRGHSDTALDRRVFTGRDEHT
ncbi:uncharacterized protein MONBRDRAFT_11688 [Monosiga brevicollis MX1]|uniref:Purple acid phosphatase n=1 Tax=Monosiga brevicollis TaxID=81824 RepID=A9V9Z9_MONBE|nr:uncharacterized protein MONBRDRAFT_11688 [Monosiga brevicollis MX1]EDQ85642.1 predicted protein [Monosiga brevicollis MX1]|eukprot:XP_001749591.1 hypothetical protein [Monosiga brevicollis MX1]